MVQQKDYPIPAMLCFGTNSPPAGSNKNAEFIALYQAIINGGLAEPEGSGKSSAATATVSDIAQNVLSANSSLAQSMLAVYKNNDYIRHGEPVNLKSADTNTLPDFDIAPNPASNVVNVNIKKPTIENRSLLVFRPDGQLVLSVTVPAYNRQITLDTQQLPSGLYFCKLTNSSHTAKLAIVK